MDKYLFGDLNKNYSDNEIQYKNSFLEMTICEMRDSFRQYLKWIQEDIFERIRNDNYPSLPSRRHCLWVCNYEQLINWWTILCEGDDRFRSNPKKILKLELNGIFHQADGTLIKADTYNIEEIEERARLYWEGKIESDKEIEMLFLGQVKVLNEYTKIDEIVNNH